MSDELEGKEGVTRRLGSELEEAALPSHQGSGNLAQRAVERTRQTEPLRRY